MATKSRHPPSLQLNARTLGSVQQPSEVKASKGVAGIQPDQRRKGWHRRAVSGFELGEGLRILRRGRSLECRLRQRFESPQRLAATAQHQIADRSPLKFFGIIGDRGADANAS